MPFSYTQQSTVREQLTFPSVEKANTFFYWQLLFTYPSLKIWNLTIKLNLIHHKIEIVELKMFDPVRVVRLSKKRGDFVVFLMQKKEWAKIEQQGLIFQQYWHLNTNNT